MKKFFAVLTAGLFCLSLSAQVKVETTGRMVVGPAQKSTTGIVPKPLAGDTAASVLVWDRNTPGPGYISFGDKKGWVGFHSTDTDGKISLYGVKGLRIKALVGNVLMDASTTGTEFSKDVRAQSFITTSDERVKKDINSLDGISSGLKSITPLSYHLIEPTPVNEDGLKSLEIADLNGRDIIETTKKKDRLRYGFLAQEVQKFYPDLVVENEDGLLGIDYTGFIPLYLEAIQNLNAQVEKMQERISELEEQIQEGVRNRRSSNLNGEEVSMLKQNTPNPWSTETVIECNIPEEASSACISIFNYAGDEVKRVICPDKGNISVTIGRDGLPKGVYVYSLFVNNIETQSKVMIIKD